MARVLAHADHAAEAGDDRARPNRIARALPGDDGMIELRVLHQPAPNGAMSGPGAAVECGAWDRSSLLVGGHDPLQAVQAAGQIRNGPSPALVALIERAAQFAQFDIGVGEVGAKAADLVAPRRSLNAALKTFGLGFHPCKFLGKLA